MEGKKVIAITVSTLAVGTMILFAMGKVDQLTLWIVLLLSALIAYKGLPAVPTR